MAEFVVIAVFILFVIGILYLRSPSVRGAIGESRVNSSLQRKLDGNKYVTLHDLTLPTARGTTQVDHVILAHSGIFVVETKNMSGWIFGSANKAKWTQVLPKFKKQFQNPLHQNYGHIKAIQKILDVPSSYIHNVVVFAGGAEPKTQMPSNVLWRASSLPDYILSHNNSSFSHAEIKSFEKKLTDRALEKTRQTRREHVQKLKERPEKNIGDNAICPRCRSNLVERTNRKTGEKFWGCSKFPKCRFVRKA